MYFIKINPFLIKEKITNAIRTGGRTHAFILFTILSITVLLSFFITTSYLKNKNDLAANEIKKKASTNPIISLSLSMSKELRQIAASYLWLRVDEYFHSTAVKMSENSEIVPLFKLVTIFDPSFIDAYIVLAHHLAFHLDKIENSLMVLKEAINNNLHPPAPRLSELYFQAGWIYAMLKKETNEAILMLDAGQKYMNSECDQDNAHLALRLNKYLKNSLDESFDINSFHTKFGQNDIRTKMINEHDLNHNHEHKHEHEHEHGVCIHEHDLNHNHEHKHEHEHEHGVCIHEHEGDKEHRYAGSNPWHNPYQCKRLKNASYFYICLLILIITGLKLSTIYSRRRS